MCTWAELGNGQLTMLDLMQMHRSLNLKNYIEEQSLPKGDK
jgi:hypothetical protein